MSNYSGSNCPCCSPYDGTAQYLEFLKKIYEICHLNLLMGMYKDIQTNCPFRSTLHLIFGVLMASAMLFNGISFRMTLINKIAFLGLLLQCSMELSGIRYFKFAIGTNPFGRKFSIFVHVLVYRPNKNVFKSLVKMCLFSQQWKIGKICLRQKTPN